MSSSGGIPASLPYDKKKTNAAISELPPARAGGALNEWKNETVETANERNITMNNEPIIWMIPMGADLPEIIMQKYNDSRGEEICYEITADESGKIREVSGFFGHDLRNASRSLLRTLLRLDISPEKALTVTKKFYLATKRLSVLPPERFPIHASGKNCSSNS